MAQCKKTLNRLRSNKHVELNRHVELNSRSEYSFFWALLLMRDRIKSRQARVRDGSARKLIVLESAMDIIPAARSCQNQSKLHEEYLYMWQFLIVDSKGQIPGQSITLDDFFLTGNSNETANIAYITNNIVLSEWLAEQVAISCVQEVFVQWTFESPAYNNTLAVTANYTNIRKKLRCISNCC